MGCSPYIVTYSGEEFHPTDPNLLQIHIRDIAHALSNQCRFAGHTREFYSVAQHSLLVLYLYQGSVGSSALPNTALWCLLHDAAEAYLVDLPRPIKQKTVLGTEYSIMEARLQECIAARFLLTPTIPGLVHTLDEYASQLEAERLMPRNPCFWQAPIAEVEWLRVPTEPSAVRSRFLWEYGHWTYRLAGT